MADDASSPHRSPPPCPFIEVLPAREGAQAGPPDEVECYVSTLSDPKRCGPLLGALSACAPIRAPTTPTGEGRADGGGGEGSDARLGHLKRVRRARGGAGGAPSAAATPAETDAGAGAGAGADATAPPSRGGGDDDGPAAPPPAKRRKGGRRGSDGGGGRGGTAAATTLEVVLGTVARIDRLLRLAPPRATDDVGGDGSAAAGAVDRDAEEADDVKAAVILRRVLRDHSLSLEKRFLPGRPAGSQSELDEWNARNGGAGWWPTLHRRERTDEFKEEEEKLSGEEVAMMAGGVREAILDARAGREMWERWKKTGGGADDARRPMEIAGCVIVDPATGEVVSRSSDERREQMIQAARAEASGAGPASEKRKNDDGEGDDDGDAEFLSSPLFPDRANPLSTSVLLAIQGVSRRERSAASSLGMANPAFHRGQYLCTGYDVCCTLEPGPFESMALVHSRVRRVIYGASDPRAGGLGSNAGVHALPGTNHRYRAFRCGSEDGEGGGAASGGGERNGDDGNNGAGPELYRACRELHPSVGASNGPDEPTQP